MLGDQIAAEFKNGVINAFTATWIAAGLFALLGLLGAFFTRMPSHKVAAFAQDGERLEEAEVPAVKSYRELTLHFTTWPLTFLYGKSTDSVETP